MGWTKCLAHFFKFSKLLATGAVLIQTKQMKVFITRIIPEEGMRLLKDAGLKVEVWEEKRPLTKDELIERCLQADALLSVSTKIDAEFLNACRHLKVIALHSVGYDNVDIEEATELKIPIGNTPGVLSAATADTAFLLMLATSRKAFFLHKQILEGNWGFFEPTANLGIELMGKTLGVFGLGNIGLEMARRCKGAYSMDIIYHNRSRNEAAESELGAVMVSFEELLEKSDVLSVHTSLTPETKGIFNLAAFGK
jgi:glyoxylate reductase